MRSRWMSLWFDFWRRHSFLKIRSSVVLGIFSSLFYCLGKNSLDLSLLLLLFLLLVLFQHEVLFAVAGSLLKTPVSHALRL